MERKSKFILNLKKGVLAAFGITSALFIASCEIGLGAAVDTERPKLEITYPPKGAIIMDTFTLAGTVSDDVGLTYLNVTLTNKDLKTTYTYSSKDGQVNWTDPGKDWPKGTTWTASLGKKTEGQSLYNGWDLPDGEYFVDVEANDGYGSVYDRRSVTIDNTPPVFIVDNLISISGNTNSTSVFGNKINLTGQAKDDSGISKVLFSAYAEDGTEKLSSKLDYEYTSEGVLLARYKENPETSVEKTLAANFNAIYGSDFSSGSIETRYLTAKLSDNARKYVSPVFESLDEEAEKTLGTGDGNLTTEMYLKTQEFKQTGISIDELKEYKKQLQTNTELAGKLTKLASTSIADVSYSGSFTNVTKLEINPKLEPYWYINNYEEKDDGNYETLYVGSPLTFHFEMGNNKQKFRPSNIYVVLAKLNDTNGTVSSEADIKKVSESSEDAIVLVKKGDWSSDLTESFTKSVSINDPLIHTPCSYRIFVFGYDGSGKEEDGQKFESKDNKTFGFTAKKNTAAPKIIFLAANDVKDGNGKALPKDGSGIGPGTENIPFWFKVLTDGEKLANVPAIKLTVGEETIELAPSNCFKLTKDSDALEENPGKEIDPTDLKEKYSYTFKWMLEKGATPLPTKATDPRWNDEFDFNIEVKAEDLGGHSSTNTISFELDNKEPVVSIEDVASPDMIKTGNKLNGTVEIPVSFTDNNPASGADGKSHLEYTVYDKAETKVFGPAEVENEKNIILNTTSFPADICLKVSVTDKFGNTGTEEKEYSVDQTTDAPKLTFSQLKSGTANSFGIKTNNVIEIAVSDDDSGFGKIEVRVRDFDAADWTTEKWYTINTGKTTANWNFVNHEVTDAEGNKTKLITTDGKYKVQFRVTDSVGLDSGIVLSDTFDVLADSTKPVIGDISVANAVLDGSEYFVKKDATANVTFDITETNLKTVTVNGTPITASSVIGDVSSFIYNWTPTASTASGVYELEFDAKDESENSSFKAVTIHYVKDLPVISEVEITPEVLTGNKVNGVISYKGNVDQSRNDTKIKKIELKLKQNDSVIQTKTVENSASYEWTSVDTTAFADKKALVLEVTATDIAGNSNAPESFTVNVDQDTDTPELKLNNLKSGENAFGLSDNNVIEGYVTDDDAGFGKIEVRVRDASAADWPTETWSEISTGSTAINWNYNSTGKITAEGKYIVQFRATDSVGLAKGVVLSDEYTVIADDTKPVFGAETVLNGTKDGNEYFVKKNTTATVNLDVTEANLKEVTVNGSKTGVTVTAGANNKSTVTYKWIPAAGTASGSYDLVFAAKDKSGNTATEKTVTIHYVKEAPVFTEIQVSPEVLTGNKVNGIIGFSGGVNQSTNDTKIKKIELSLKQNGSVISGYTKTVNDSASFTWNGINTTEAVFTNKEDLVLEIIATDIAGNSGTTTVTVNVDQDTDKPVISFEEDKIDVNLESFDDVEDPEKNPNSKKNLLGINDNNSFYIYVTDDDAVKNVTVQAYVGDSNTPAGSAKVYAASELDSENKVECKLSDLGITSAGNYTIKVNATDDKTKTGLTDASSAEEKTVYIVVDGVAPVIDDVKVGGKTSPVYINDTKDITFKVTEMHLSEVTVDGTKIEDLGTPDTSTGAKVYSYSVPYTPSAANRVVTIVAKDSSGLSASKEITINHDNSAPVINTPTVTPTVFNTTTVNEIITITGTVTDESGYAGVGGKVNDSDLKVKLERLDGETWSKIESAVFTIKNQKYTLTDFDTTTLKDKTDDSKPFKGKIRISVQATDRAGNVPETNPKYFEYNVDQDSDLPAFRFTNVDATATEAKTNLFGFGKWNITGTVKDDDGAVKLYYRVGAGTYTEVSVNAIDNNNEQSFSFEVPHSGGEKGDKSVEFLCVDRNGASDSETSKKTSKTILYAIDNQKPEFTSRKLNGKEYESGMFAGASRTITLEVSDDNGIAKVEYYTPADGETAESWTTITPVSGKYTHSINNTTQGNRTNKYRVTDNYDRVNETEMTYTVDTTAPSGTAAIKVAGADYDAAKWLSSGSVEIEISGISDTYLTDSVSYAVTGDSSGSGNVSISGGKVSNSLALMDGNSTVTYTYTDKAGNTTPVTVDINVDSGKPTATVTAVSGIKQPGSLTLTFNASDPVKGAGRALQQVSGLKHAYIGTSPDFSLTAQGGTNGYLQKKDLYETSEETVGGETKTVTTYPASKESVTASVTIPSTDGKFNYYVVLEDMAGNISPYTAFGEFTIDGTAPVVKINDVADADTSTPIIDVNKTIRISGTAEDTNASSTVPALAIYAKGADGNKSGEAITTTDLITPVSTPANTFASWAYDVDTTKLSDNTEYKFEVTATDLAGNTGTSSKDLKVNQTSDCPVITLDNVNTDGNTTLSEGKFTWTVSDDDGAVSLMKVKVLRKDGKKADGTTDKWTNDAAAGDQDSNGFVTVTANNGVYTYNIPTHTAGGNDTADGTYKLYFQVTDAKSTTFTTTDTTTDAKTEPRVKTKDSDSIIGNVISFEVDGTPPVFNSVTVQKERNNSGNYTDTAGVFKSSEYYGGPNKRYAKLTIDVTDNVCETSDLTVKVKIGNADPETITYSNGNGFTKEIDFYEKKEGDSFKIPSGLVTIRIDASDKSGKENSKFYNIYVDNLKPNEEGKAVQNITPSADTEVTATVSVSANINDDSTANSRVASVKYYVPKKHGTGASAVNETTASESTAWSTTDLTFSDVVMKLELKGLATSEGEIEDVYSGHTQTAPESGIYNIPLWFRVEDKCGNVSYVTDKSIRYNPDAVRPRIKMTYPVHDHTVGSGDSAKNYVVLGGTILLAGTAEDNVAVDAVYVQYDINGDGKYNKDDVKYLIDAGYSVVNIETKTAVTYTGTEEESNITFSGVTFNNDDTCDKWGIKVDGTNSWNTEFSVAGLTGLEIGSKDADGKSTNLNNKTLNIRLCARDKDTPEVHSSAWTEELHVSINNSVPQFGKFYLVQYNNSGSQIKKVPYDAGMYITGTNWKLEGTVIDNDGISSVKNGTTEIADKKAYTDPATASDEHPYTGFSVKVPVEPDSNGKFSGAIAATDTAATGASTTYYQYSVNVDNTPPTFKDGANDDTLVLYAGSYNGTKLDGTNYLQNSNGWTTIASKAGEAGSGFSRAVFYAERYSSKTAGENPTYTNRRFYNVITGSRVEASGVSFTDNLPCVEKTITAVSGDSYSFTIDALNENIREGGLVIIGNVYKTITAIDSTAKKITVSEQIIWPSDNKAKFVYAFVVDHSGESTNSDGSIRNDDKDGIVESITRSANEYTWDASFDSSKIPDGPLEIHVVLFDVAGNARHSSVVTRISNNPPRITSVKLGTDLNFNDSVEDTDTYSEYTQFYAFKNNRGDIDTTQGKEVWNLVPSDETESKDKPWVIKKDLSLKPEFVGGKAPFYFVFSKDEGVYDETTNSDARLSQPAAGTNLSSAITAPGAQGKFDEHGALTVPSSVLGTGGENGVNTYRFSFWDSTEESTPGVNTGWCILNVELKQDLEDENKPTAYVHPFFWNGRGDGNNSVSWDGNTAKGHVELEADLTSDITSATDGTTTLGSDPKVSGEIVIRGTAYDDTRLSKVVVTYDGIIDGSTNKCEASYGSSGWTDESTAEKGYSLSVTDLNGGVTQNGHLVEWALTIDTSKISGETGLDKKVSVTAVAAYGGNSYNTSTAVTDSNHLTSTATFYATADQAALGKYYATEANALAHKDNFKTVTTDQTEIWDRVVEEAGLESAAVAAAGETPASPAVYRYKVYGTLSEYQMDIVPYVTEVVTNLSSGKPTNPSVYNRTANGHYPVQSVVSNVAENKMTNTASENIVLRGFNLGGTVSVAAASTTNATALAGAKFTEKNISSTEKKNGKKIGDLYFNAATLNSGRPDITVNGIPLMNNLNSNGAKGSCASADGDKEYENCYNRTPNYENNNNLTDDIEFDVWEFNDTIIKAIENKFISGFVMQINQNNSMVQYAFGSQRYFVAGQSADYSTVYQSTRDDYVVPSSIGFHVNEKGTNFFSTVLDGQDETYFRLYNNGTGTNISAQLEGTGAGIKDQRKSSVFASRTTTANSTDTVHVYHAFYNKISKAIEMSTGTSGSITGIASDTVVSAGSAGEYVSIAVTPKSTDTSSDDYGKDVVCVVWYNQAANKVQYKYKEDAAGASPSWNTTVTDIFTGGGQHCQIAADANGGIHIAAFVNGSLKYAYAPSYSSDFQKCTVDAGNTGNNLKLDVALVNVAPSGNAVYRPVPVIGYYSGTGQRPKYAKLMTSEWLNGTSVKTAASFTPSDGMTSDKFTGSWEVNYVPVLKTLTIDAEEKIYVGLWKHRYNENNVQAGSITNSTATNSTWTVSSASTANWNSYTYGNGTSNAILCYIADGGARIESAQMR